MNQSELEANTCNRQCVRENSSGENKWLFLYKSSNWLRKWRDFYKPSLSEVRQNQSVNEPFHLSFQK